MALKDVVRKVYNKLLVNNEGYLKYLRSCGVTIGEDVTFHCPGETHVDVTDPHLLTIGDHVNLTGPITILTHDFSWSVVKGKTGEVLGNEKPVTIGNNVFVGWGATILCGTTIEDNVIIGAHAVVSGHVEGDSVFLGGGCPLGGFARSNTTGRSVPPHRSRRPRSMCVASGRSWIAIPSQRRFASTSRCSRIPSISAVCMSRRRG